MATAVRCINRRRHCLLDLLTPPPSEVEPVDTFALEQMARLVEARLADFRIKADVATYSPGPVITALN